MMDSDSILIIGIILLVAESKEDAERRLLHFTDRALYSTFAITSTDRTKPNCYPLHRRVYKQKAPPKANDKPSLLQQRSPALPKILPLFNVRLFGVIKGANQRSVLLRLSDYLMKKAHGSHQGDPFVSDGVFVIEEYGGSGEHNN